MQIMYVCTGNQCRSVMAEYYTRASLPTEELACRAANRAGKKTGQPSRCRNCILLYSIRLISRVPVSPFLGIGWISAIRGAQYAGQMFFNYAIMHA